MSHFILSQRVSTLYRSLTCLPVSIGVPFSLKQINNSSFHHRHLKIVVKLNLRYSVNPVRFISFSTISLKKDGLLKACQVVANRSEAKQNVGGGDNEKRRGNHGFSETTVNDLTEQSKDCPQHKKVKHKIKSIDNVANKSKWLHLCSEYNKKFATLRTLIRHLHAVHRKGTTGTLFPECSQAFSQLSGPAQTVHGDPGEMSFHYFECFKVCIQSKELPIKCFK